MRDGVRPGKQCSLYYSQNMSVVCVWGGGAEAKDCEFVQMVCALTGSRSYPLPDFANLAPGAQNWPRDMFC